MDDHGEISMSDLLKISGKKVEIPAPESGWSFNLRPGGWLIAERATDKGTERRRLFISESKGFLSVNSGGFTFHGQVVQTDRRGSGAAGSDSDLVAQFPGKVRKILVKAGDTVQEGDPLLLIEAMKMEFAVKATFAGTIKAVKVTEGQQLSPGDRFVDMEIAKSSNAK